MYIRNKRQLLPLSGVLLLVSLMLISPAFADGDDDGFETETVNCNDSDASIQETIDKVDPGRKTVIFIRGRCVENVLIEKDDITLSGNKDGDGTLDGGVTGTITIVGARRVTIEYLRITGPNQGVQALDGATVRVEHNEIVDNISDGVAAFNNALVRVNFNTITGNGRLELLEAGIDAGNNTTVRSNGNYIADNGYAAVEVGNAVHWRSDGGDIIVQAGCNQGDTADTRCGAAGTIAVDCFRYGSCHVRDADITGSSFASGFSYFDISNTTINGDIGVATGSGLRLRDGATGSGFVTCFDPALAMQNATCGAPIPPPPPPP